MQSVFGNSGSAARKALIGSFAVLMAIFLGTWTAASLVRNSTQSMLAFTIGAALFLSVVVIGGRMTLARYRELETLGLRDPLTGLRNRHALHSDIARMSASDEIGLALLNLDGFRLVNDHYGHQIGDATIKEIAEILQTLCGDEVSVYRLNGDEFALLMGGTLAGTLLEGQCRRVIERLTKTVSVGDRRITLGASIGLVARSARAATSGSELLRRADVAMAASKRSGKMRCTWYSEAFDRSREKMRELDDELRNALVKEEFELAYQPLVSSRTRHVVAVECLLRWNRADGRSIGPHVFIPAAEETGLINAIGLWVLRKACRDALAWDDITLSVNISAMQLRNPEFPIQLGQVLEETGFDPRRLELEITETCLVLDPIVAERSLAVIRKFGVRIALDDFGTGYASIGFLRQFRFEKLKLDRSLVVQASEDEGSRAMMLSSIAVARAMKMGVTAEGVETPEQADMVRAAGCDQIQGWLYFKALPARDIAQHLGHPITATSAQTLSPPASNIQVA